MLGAARFMVSATSCGLWQTPASGGFLCGSLYRTEENGRLYDLDYGLGVSLRSQDGPETLS